MAETQAGYKKIYTELPLFALVGILNPSLVRKLELVLIQKRNKMIVTFLLKTSLLAQTNRLLAVLKIF